MNAITTTAPGWSAALSPSTTDEAWKVATALAKSQLVPKAYHGQPSEILIAAAMGARLGLDVFSALQSLAVVNGKPTLYGDALLAVCQARPDWRGMAVNWTGKGDDEMIAVTVRRFIAGEIISTDGRFSVAEAKKAGLWTKQGPWSQFPKRMLEMRARSFALRGAFADALLGFHAREEVEDAIDTTAEVVTERPAPRTRMRTVQATVGIPEEAQATTADPVAAEPGPAAPAASEDVVLLDESPAAAKVTEDHVREAINRAAQAIGSSPRKIASKLEEALGYKLENAASIKPEDRARAVAIADDMAVLPPAGG